MTSLKKALGLAALAPLALALSACGGRADTRETRGNGSDATFTVNPEAGVCMMVIGVSERSGEFGFFQSKADMQVNPVECTQSVLDQLPRSEREAYLAAGHKAVPQPYQPQGYQP